MKKQLKAGIGSVVFAGGLLISALPATAQAPSANPSSAQSPSSSPSTMQRTDPTMDQMQHQSDQHMDQGAKKMAKSGDAAFAIKAAQGGQAEVKMGKLAAEKGADADVKAFGQMMVDDHSKANEKLKSVAEEKGMKLPSD